MSKRHSQTLLAILLVAWVLPLIFRVVLFREGGEIGAYACTIVFAIASIGLAILSIVKLIDHRPGETLPFALILVAMLSFAYRAFVDGPTASIASLIFYACVMGLMIIFGRRKWGNDGPTAPPISANG
jgi:type IV secretory pathway VirB2 component (pilin)